MYDSYKKQFITSYHIFFENVDRGGELEKHLVLFYKAVRTGIPTNSQQKVDRCDEW